MIFYTTLFISLPVIAVIALIIDTVMECRMIAGVQRRYIEYCEVNKAIMDRPFDNKIIQDGK